MSETILRISSEGTPFAVRIVRKGDRFGLRHALTHHQSEPLVEFYDARHDNDKFDPGLGQFIARYHISILTGTNPNARRKPGQGLLLDTASPDWRIAAPVMETIVEWITKNANPPPSANH